MISYEDFDLRFSADGGGFVISAEYRGSRTTEPFDLDMSRRWNLWEPEESGPRDAMKMGTELFGALIQGSVLALYGDARGRAGDDPEKGVRIRIQINPKEPRLRPFQAVPWEILFDSLRAAGKYVGLDPRMPIVRMLDSVMETLPEPSEMPLRVLLAVADPRLSVVLDLESELSKVEKALAEAKIRPTVLRQATRESLGKHIRDGRFHVVHFLGHGDFTSGSEEGSLILEKERASPDPLSASEFAALFEGQSMPRLVVLNACRTAEQCRGTGVRPYAGVAAALIAEGLPAVVAMQTAVRDRSASPFAERLYERLSQGDSIESAVVEGRKILKARWSEFVDWAVPVLFVRGRAGEGGGQHPVAVPPLNAASAQAQPTGPINFGSTTINAKAEKQVIASQIGVVNF
ncbi:MAG TPA: CHAT domain-containing protein [Thermoanaerobaculia bacterium]|jgi:hypothetical protein|nr:CHAT domain-containing protein [Thermoanaerobaculia bacterium]